MHAELEYAYKILPNLRTSKHEITSQKSTHYNCLAWVFDETKYRWWPNKYGKWFSGIPQNELPLTFIRFFEKLGFAECDDWRFENGITKVSMFAKDGLVTHFAVQHPHNNGLWSSKIGLVGHDISHDDISAFEDRNGYGLYGQLEAILRYEGDVRSSEMQRKLRDGQIISKPQKKLWYAHLGHPF